MKFKISIIVTALSLIFANSLYGSINSVQAVQDGECIDNPKVIAECYDPDASIGTLQERIDLYNYLTSDEYTQSAFERIENPDGSVSYNSIDGVKQYIRTNETLENGEIIQYIYYTDDNGNDVRLHNDGVTELLVSEKYNQYYVDQLQDYSKVLDEINQELGTDYSFDFELSTFEDAEQSVDMYKSMTLDEFKTYMTNAVKETEGLFDSVQ